MARTPKKKSKAGTSGLSIFDDAEPVDAPDDEDLPKDEAGRAKIKQQYVDLLGIRIKKKRGNILNRERINKTLEGIYFICARCEKVCHNLDEGLVEDDKNLNNLCVACAKASQAPLKAAGGAKGDGRKEKSEGAGAKGKAAKAGRSGR